MTSWPDCLVPELLEAFQNNHVSGFSSSRAAKTFVSIWQHSQVVHVAQFPFQAATLRVLSRSTCACVLYGLTAPGC